MTECPICKSETEIQEISDKKKKKLIFADSDLEGSDIKKTVCKKCGHTSYIR